MSGWIKFDKDMVDDPRLVEAATTLLDRYLVAERSPGGGRDLSHGDASRFVTASLRGALVTLWAYADRHVRDDDVMPCDAAAVDAIVGIDGFCDVMPDEWLRVDDATGLVVLPGYCKKNNILGKRNSASKGAERTRKWREKKKNRDAKGDDRVTRHKERHIVVTKHADQDQDQDKEKTSSSKKAAAPPKLPSDILWGPGLEFLVERGVPERKARGLVGKWIRDFEHEAVLKALRSAKHANTGDPVPYIEKALGNVVVMNGASKAWDEAIALARDSRRAPELASAELNQAVGQIGGWRAIGGANTFQLNALKSKFVEAYRATQSA